MSENTEVMTAKLADFATPNLPPASRRTFGSLVTFSGDGGVMAVRKGPSRDGRGEAACAVAQAPGDCAIR